ncbi:MAG: LysR family transcriptional regulator [bacterium]|nr:LysR family transcriptional regulator [bacterium]
MKVKLSSININLLIILDALLMEKNTTRAAKKLSLTQSTVSKHLKQLRRLFHDELLVRVCFNSYMTLTPRAEELIIPVREIINRIENLFENEQFNPSTRAKHFRIGMHESTVAVVFPKLIAEFRKTAPICTVSAVQIESIASPDEFNSLKLDAALLLYGNIPKCFISEVLGSLNSVCLSDRNHPVLKSSKLTKEIFLNSPHILAASGQEIDFEMNLEKIFKDNKIMYFKVPYLLAALSMLRDTDLLCVVHDAINLDFQKSFDFIVKKLPIELPEIDYKLIWSPDKKNDSANIWLRKIIKKVVSNKKDKISYL